MKQAEKNRLTILVRDAVDRIGSCPSKVKDHAGKLAARYSPTSADQYRKLSELVWWLIAVDCVDDALTLLDALCEVDDDYYWMFHALGSAYAARAWLKAPREQAASLEDARTASLWLGRDPNGQAPDVSEVHSAIERFDGWMERAAGERGTLTALQVVAHALRVLVLYQQLAVAGDPAAGSVPPSDFSDRIESGVRELRRRINEW